MPTEISTPIHESYWVIPGRLSAGEYPGAVEDEEARGKLRWLIEQDTHMILDLTEEGEHGLRSYAEILLEESAKIPYSIVHKRIPLQDFSTPDILRMAEILDTIDLALSLGRNVYLHCFGGKGRTGTVVGCFLVRYGMSGTQALERIQELRKALPGKKEQSPETEGQKRMVLEWKKGQ